MRWNNTEFGRGSGFASSGQLRNRTHLRLTTLSVFGLGTPDCCNPIGYLKKSIIRRSRSIILHGDFLPQTQRKYLTICMHRKSSSSVWFLRGRGRKFAAKLMRFLNVSQNSTWVGNLLRFANKTNKPSSRAIKIDRPASQVFQPTTSEYVNEN